MFLFKKKQVEDNIQQKDVEQETKKTKKIDINYSNLGEALDFIFKFNFEKPIYRVAFCPKHEDLIHRIKLDENISIEVLDCFFVNKEFDFNGKVNILKIKLRISDVTVRKIYLMEGKKKWGCYSTNEFFPLSNGVINFINKWLDKQLEKKHLKIKNITEMKNQKFLEKLDYLNSIYDQYKEEEIEDVI